MLSIAQLQSDMISDSWKEAQDKRRRDGLPTDGKPRWGYIYEGKRYRVDESLRETLKTAYESYVSGASLRGMALDGSAYFGNRARVEDYASQHRDSHGQGFKVAVPTKWLRRNNIEPMEDFLNEGAVEYSIPSQLFDEFNSFPRTPWKPGGA